MKRPLVILTLFLLCSALLSAQQERPSFSPSFAVGDEAVFAYSDGFVKIEGADTTVLHMLSTRFRLKVVGETDSMWKMEYEMLDAIPMLSSYSDPADAARLMLSQLPVKLPLHFSIDKESGRIVKYEDSWKWRQTVAGRSLDADLSGLPEVSEMSKKEMSQAVIARIGELSLLFGSYGICYDGDRIHVESVSGADSETKDITIDKEKWPVYIHRQKETKDGEAVYRNASLIIKK